MANKHRTITEALEPYKATTPPASRQQSDVEPFEGFTVSKGQVLLECEPWPTQITWLDDTEM